MLQQPTAATPAEPLESLSFPDMREVEAVLSPQDVNKGLAQADPLTRHPRVSSIVLCVVFGLLMLAASAGVWWLGVRTMDGQSYEDIVWSKFDAALPGWLAPVVHVFAISAVVITVSVIMGAIAFAVLIVRKRWLSIAQLAVFGGLCFAAAELLKPLLPRPYLINLESNPNNSAPSGHVILAAAASVMLLCAVPRVLRALVAVIGWAYTVLVGLSVIAASTIMFAGANYPDPLADLLLPRLLSGNGLLSTARIVPVWLGFAVLAAHAGLRSQRNQLAA